jgi:hypothetical protein
MLKAVHQLAMDSSMLGSSLYSDIGPRYYAQLGWKCYPSISLFLEIDKTLRKEASINFFYFQSRIQLMTDSQVHLALSKEADEIRESFQKHSDESRFCILPDPDAHDWLVCRSRFYWRLRKAKEEQLNQTHGSIEIQWTGAQDSKTGDYFCYYLGSSLVADS